MRILHDPIPTTYFKLFLKLFCRGILGKTLSLTLTGAFPTAFKTTLMKTQKIDYSVISNYRPISNLPPGLRKNSWMISSVFKKFHWGYKAQHSMETLLSIVTQEYMHSLLGADVTELIHAHICSHMCPLWPVKPSLSSTLVTYKQLQYVTNGLSLRHLVAASMRWRAKLYTPHYDIKSALFGEEKEGLYMPSGTFNIKWIREDT